MVVKECFLQEEKIIKKSKSEWKLKKKKKSQAFLKEISP